MSDETTQSGTGPTLATAAGSERRREKRAAVLTVIRMVESWICDGCPTRDDSGERVASSEANRILRGLQARMCALQDKSPNATGSPTGAAKQEDAPHD